MTGNTTISGNLMISSASIDGNLSVTGNTTLGGNILTNGTITTAFLNSGNSTISLYTGNVSFVPVGAEGTSICLDERYRSAAPSLRGIRRRDACGASRDVCVHPVRRQEEWSPSGSGHLWNQTALLR